MLNARLKSVLDFLPLVVFFVGYKWVGLPAATAALVLTTLMIVALLFIIERRVAFVPLVTALVVSLFGGLSLWLHNDMFIKMKPTVVNALFAAILWGGCWRGKGVLRHVMGSAVHLTDRGWWLLSFRFGGFFLAMALVNECVWRTMPTDWWVNFKVFGLLGCTLLFTASQAGFIQKFQQEP